MFPDEKAWCLGLSSKPREAARLFATVAKESHWSPAFYSYLSACFYLEASFRDLFLLKEDKNPANPSLNTGDQTRESQEMLRKALSLFRLVPNAVKKRKFSAPPEVYAAHKSQAISVVVNKILSITSEAQVNLQNCSDVKIKQLLNILFWPSWEIAYFWNGFFQIERRQDWIQDLDQSVRLINNFQPEQYEKVKLLYHLFKGSLLREEGKIIEADQELSLVVPSFEHSTKDEDQRWIIEFSKYERGLCAWEMKEKKEAAAWWNAIKDSNHPLDQRLRFRIRTALRRV